MLFQKRRTVEMSAEIKPSIEIEGLTDQQRRNLKKLI